MKKNVLILSAAFMLTACITTTKTSKTAELPASFYTATIADVEVTPERYTWDSGAFQVPKAIQRAGMNNVKRHAEQRLLEAVQEQTGKTYDMILEPEYAISVKKNFFSTNIIQVRVSGRPAKYTNFRSPNDSVWVDPVFRLGYKNNVNTSGGGLGRLFGK